MKKIIRRIRIYFGWWDLMHQMRINGVVKCKCGGRIISNTGYIVFAHNHKQIKCNQCWANYDANEVYYVRKAGKTIIFK